MEAPTERQDPPAAAGRELPGDLGARWDGATTRFRIISRNAEALWLCLFAGPEAAETDRLAMERRGEALWELEVSGIGPGQLYGFRAAGPFEPRHGHRFNPSKLLFDPAAFSHRGELRWDDALFDGGERPDGRDSAPFLPKSEVCDGRFDWGRDRPPATSWEATVVYEVHVKGMTALHPEVAPEDRGTFRGLAHPAVLAHLVDLGVTALELMPVQLSISERRLHRLGLSNYWGYNSLGLSAPDRRFCAGDDPGAELKALVKACHAAGLEVILDVVYNHTAEGGEQGPTLSLKGLDNLSYYLLEADAPSRYANFSGCGNALDLRQPPALALVLDSLRHWVREYRVDGFRFDLAPILGRGGPRARFDPRAALFTELRRDPLFSRVKLVAEPWDLGPGGYRLGEFPAGWSQWNDRYRDTVRSFWRGDGGRLAELATRIAGSSDLFPSPAAGVNLVSCHDGFTLRDVVSYESKHNLANGEQGRDGHDHNFSRNWGVEGPTADAAVEELRRRAQRNLLATLVFSRGVPLLGHGDELGRTQLGNNNAYCQDGPLSWVHWPSGRDEGSLLELLRRALELRRRHPLLRRCRFFAAAAGEEDDGLAWLRPDGRPLAGADWHDGAEGEGRAAAALLTPAQGRREAPLLLLLNGGDAATSFQLPPPGLGRRWRTHLDTARFPRRPATGDAVEAYSLRLLAAESGEIAAG